MRLTGKLVFAITCAILLVLGVNAVIRVDRTIELFEEDIRRDTRMLGRAVGGAAGRVWREIGKAEALDLIRDANERESHVGIRWVWLDEPMETAFRPAVPLSELRGRGDLVFRQRAPNEDVDSIYVYVPVDIPGDRRGAVELRESLTTERAFVRTQIGQAIVTTTVLALLCGLIATALGVAFVGRPVRKLVEQARRIGSGDLSGRLELRQRDEIGDLGAEMNAMSQRLADARDQLQAETAARLRTLEQLRHADRLTTVGKLAAGVAHEVGTPLNVITGHAQLIIDDSKEPAARENATVITQQAHRVTEIVRQLLDFARPRKPRKDRTDIAALCRQVTSLLDPLARKRRVAIQHELTAVEIEADAAQLQQVLTNLVINAVQAMPDGGTLVVGTASEGEHARIWVRDTGTGIPAEVEPRIFEPFFTTKDIGEGTGLGLSVAYGIVVEHGGRIDVDTAPGRGTTFTISLPRLA